MTYGTSSDPGRLLRQQIIDLVTKQPMTPDDMAHKLGSDLYTIRLQLKNLVARHRLCCHRNATTTKFMYQLPDGDRTKKPAAPTPKTPSTQPYEPEPWLPVRTDADYHITHCLSRRGNEYVKHGAPQAHCVGELKEKQQLWRD